MEKIKQLNLSEVKMSFSEWFKQFGHKKSVSLLQEDKTKEGRLDLLHQLIGLLISTPYVFKLTDVVDESEEFQKFFKVNKIEIFNLRLIPNDNSDTILRIKNVTISQALKWLKKQKVRAGSYSALFKPFTNDVNYSAVFIINDKGIFGEVIEGVSIQLTVGYNLGKPPISFSYDYKKWTFEKNDVKVKNFVKKVISFLYVGNKEVQATLCDKLEVKFINNYLQGYFECVHTNKHGYIFADFNRVIGGLYSGYSPKVKANVDDYIIRGQTASSGFVVGKVKIVSMDTIDLSKVSITKDEILVCETTTPDYVVLMKQAGGVITDKGGILSHAAIVAREFKKPCIVGTGNATMVLKNGLLIELNATEGIVRTV